MISLELARDLHAAGLIWSPLAGDRFTVKNEAMADDVYHLADMTVDVQQFVGGSVIGFNGVAEWALDSVQLEETLWLPREGQMRAVLGDTFAGLAKTDAGYAVVLTLKGERHTFDHIDAECAYGRALLAHLRTG
ncbi:MAG: hypothetical protein H0U62_09555 [Actinobacteria bacterium]|nr:hypothetical protein [Actinomycetota bacterium]